MHLLHINVSLLWRVSLDSFAKTACSKGLTIKIAMTPRHMSQDGSECG